jgi:hypothetical protein
VTCDQNLTKEIAAAKKKFEAMLVETQQAGLIDEPKRNRLRCENKQDRMYVMEYLYWRRWHIMTQDEFAEKFPETYKRLCEIMPREQPDEEE